MKNVILLSLLTIAFFGQVNANNQATQNSISKLENDLIDAMHHRFGNSGSVHSMDAMEEAEELEFDDIEENPGSLLQIQGSAKVNYSQRFETYQVQKNYFEGVNYHNAYYADGTLIITTLDGQYKGLQGIWYNGNCLASSLSIQWTKDGFVHTYPAGRVTSYANRQISELY